MPQGQPSTPLGRSATDRSSPFADQLLASLVDVPNLFALQSNVMLVLTLVLFACKAIAFVDTLVRADAVFVASGKQSKAFWLLVLGLAVALHALTWYSPIGVLNLIGTVAAFVYLADVRPAVKGLTRR